MVQTVTVNISSGCGAHAPATQTAYWSPPPTKQANSAATKRPEERTHGSGSSPIGPAANRPPHTMAERDTVFARSPSQPTNDHYHQYGCKIYFIGASA
eukprot:scaffold23424_cov121-Isochrysis_galbana.AAC.5